MIHWAALGHGPGHATPMMPLHQLMPAAIASLVRDVPLSPGKLAFAWRAAVGPAIDRASSVALAADGVLEVRVASQHWCRELRRSAPVVLERLAAILGAGTVTELDLIGPPSDQARR